MRLAFVYTPVKDLKEALGFYRDRFGFEEAWREGDLAAGLSLPGTDVKLMLDADDRETGTGPFFVVDSVADFFEANRDSLDFLFEPREIPPGLYAAFTDPSGNVVRIMDTSRERT